MMRPRTLKSVKVPYHGDPARVRSICWGLGPHHHPGEDGPEVPKSAPRLVLPQREPAQLVVEVAALLMHQAKHYSVP
jgi:hypothetical protein